MTNPGTTTPPTITVGSEYAHRRVAFQRVVDVDGFLLKLYVISLPGRAVDDELAEHAIAAARRTLPERDEPGVEGLGFLTVHDAADFSYALVNWWFSENELHQQVLSSAVGDATSLQAHPSRAIGCVWELSVTDFERRAWIANILDARGEPDVPGYLEARFVGDV